MRTQPRTWDFQLPSPVVIPILFRLAFTPHLGFPQPDTVIIKMAEPEAATTKQQVYRMSMYFKKKKDITEEEFNRHWSEVHGPLVRPLLEKYGCLRYTQVRQSRLFTDDRPRSSRLLPYSRIPSITPHQPPEEREHASGASERTCNCWNSTASPSFWSRRHRYCTTPDRTRTTTRKSIRTSRSFWTLNTSPGRLGMRRFTFKMGRLCLCTRRIW